MPYADRLAAFAIAVMVATAVAPAVAQAPAPAIIAIVPPVGGAAHYRVTRTVQGNPDSQTTVSEVTLRRKTSATLTVDGSIGGRPIGLTVLNLASDGSLQIPKNDKTASQDVQLNDLIAGLNRMSVLLANESGGTRDGWSASLLLPEIPGANVPLIVPVVIANANAVGFDLHGAGELLVQAQASSGGDSQGGHSGHGGFHGGYGGGGGREGPGRQAFTVALSVNGDVRHGAIDKLSMIETRAITVDTLPYVNVSGWTVENLK
jgi:uncharacterized membrane protein YgcG